MAGTESHHAAAPPTLHTLGSLHLSGSPVTRPKPLVLLAYLAHEGPTDRERLARLFFGASRDPRDALSTTLRRLGGLVEPSTAHDGRVRTRVTTDELEFERSAVREDPDVAVGRYGGAFVQGAPVGCGVELEEWIVATREHLGSIARDLHLRLAGSELEGDRADAAWQHAQTAIGLTESFVLDPVPTAHVLQRLDRAGLPVPEGWWRAMAALGFDRPRSRAFDGTKHASDPARGLVDGRRTRRTTAVGSRASRTSGLRKPRRRTDRP